jgi:3-dehydroquinate synthase
LLHHQRFSVAFDYPVYFTRDVFDPEHALLAEVLERRGEARRHRAFVCVDAGVAAAWPDLASQVLEYSHRHQDRVEIVAAPQIVPGGESAKSDWKLVEQLLLQLGNLHLDRQSYVLAIGGGAMLDMVGFAAALLHRGLRLVRMPTTTLAQNDAGVGVKNGMNEHGVKNFLGTFAPPFAVINDFDFLRTLPDEHWRGGLAEAFKVAAIKDRVFFDALCAAAPALGRRDQEAMEEAVRRCAVLHLDHIAQGGDAFELGAARPLDFGHWSAHKLEALSSYRVSHGAAVASGIALDSYYAMKRGLLPRADLDRLLAALAACGFRLWHEEMGQRTGAGELTLLRGLEEFREHLGGRLTITLPDGLGRKREVHHMDLDLVEEALFFLRDWQARQDAGGRAVG